jgi:integrase/recombinase XerD
MNQTHSLNRDGKRIPTLIDGDTSIQTVFDKCKKYFSWGQNTIRTYSNPIKSFVMFMNSQGLEPNLKNIEEKLCQRWIFSLLKEGKKYNTIKLHISTLSSVFTFLKEQEITDSNPFLHVRIPADDNDRVVHFLSFEEIFQIYKVLSKDITMASIQLPILTCFFTGMKRGCIDGLTIDSVSRRTKEIKRPSGLGYKQEFITIPDRLYERIIRFIDENELTDEFPQGKLPEKRLFKKPIYTSVQLLCKKLGWQDKQKITPNNFRYAFAETLFFLGVSPDAIRWGLGYMDYSSKSFITFDRLYKKEVHTAQTILEGAFEVLLTFDDKGLLKINFKQLFQQLSFLYEEELRDEKATEQIRQKVIDIVHNQHTQYLKILGRDDGNENTSLLVTALNQPITKKTKIV